MEIKSGGFTCEHCGKKITIKEQFTQEKNNEITLNCPWCKDIIGSYTSYRNKLFIVEKDIDRL